MNCVSTITEKAAVAGGHYSQAMKHSDLLYISGLLPITVDGVKLNEESFTDQTIAVLKNLLGILEASNCIPEDLISCRVYITDIENWGTFNKLYNEFVGHHKPARAVVPVPVLHFGFLLEIEAIAVQSLP
eukprot:Awhi_evm1s2937